MTKVERIKKFLLGVPEPSKCEELPRGHVETVDVMGMGETTLKHKPHFTTPQNCYGEVFAGNRTVTIEHIPLTWQGRAITYSRRK